LAFLKNLIDNLLLFPTVKKFPNWSTVDKVITKSSTPRFFLRQSVQECFEVTGSILLTVLW